MAFHFTLDRNEGNRLSWEHATREDAQPQLTEAQATIIAIASIASALDNVAAQIYNTLSPLQEIADNIRSRETALPKARKAARGKKVTRRRK